MNTDYNILMGYMESFNFSTLKELPDFFINPPCGSAHIHTDIDVSFSQNSAPADNEDHSIYLVKIPAKITAVIDDDNSTIFELQMTYSALVNVRNDIDKQQQLTALKVNAVNDIVNTKIRTIVWNVTIESGFPPIMFPDFKHDGVCDTEPASTTRPTTEASNTDDPEGQFEGDCYDEKPERFGYDYIIWQIRNSNSHAAKELHELLETEDLTSLDYEDQTFFKFYYRFFNPITYAHPAPHSAMDPGGIIDDSSWDILLQWISGSPQSKYRFAHGASNEYPEYIFDYEEFSGRAMTSLTHEEVEGLMYSLFYDAIELTLNKILKFDLNYAYCEEIQDGEIPSYEEFCKLYNCDKDSPAELQMIVQELYGRIKEYELQTFMFSSKNS